MSLIDKTDIGSRYTLTSWYVVDELEKFLATGAKSKDFPIWSFEQAKDIFRLAVETFDYPRNPGKSIAHLTLASDVLKRVTGKDYDSQEEKKKDLEVYSDLIENLPELSEENAHHYNTLLDFFQELRFIQESNRYDRTMSGRDSKYAFA